MSLIGRYVIASVYNFNSSSYQSKQYKGLVLEKYSALIDVKQDAPSGHGGSINIKVYLPVDFYMIQTETELVKVEARFIVRVLPQFEVVDIKNEIDTFKSE
jgi:hypothetical protein